MRQFCLTAKIIISTNLSRTTEILAKFETMKRIITILIMVMALTFCASAQNSVKLYDEKANPLEQIDSALKTAKKSGKYVICQVGGNWCPKDTILTCPFSSFLLLYSSKASSSGFGKLTTEGMFK